VLYRNSFENANQRCYRKYKETQRISLRKKASKQKQVF